MSTMHAALDMDDLFARSPIALKAGFLGGMISSFVKWGCEIPLPPRTPDRISPPAGIIHDLGLPMQQMSYIYSGHLILWGPIAVHVVFSLVFAVAYCLAYLVFPRIALWQGVAFGLVITVLFHGVILPLGHWAPNLWRLPPEELVSETFEHILWSWVIEMLRRQIMEPSFFSRSTSALLGQAMNDRTPSPS